MKKIQKSAKELRVLIFFICAYRNLLVMSLVKSIVIFHIDGYDLYLPKSCCSNKSLYELAAMELPFLWTKASDCNSDSDDSNCDFYYADWDSEDSEWNSDSDDYYSDSNNSDFEKLSSLFYKYFYYEDSENNSNDPVLRIVPFTSLKRLNYVGPALSNAAEIFLYDKSAAVPSENSSIISIIPPKASKKEQRLELLDIQLQVIEEFYIHLEIKNGDFSPYYMLKALYRGVMLEIAKAKKQKNNN